MFSLSAGIDNLSLKPNMLVNSSLKSITTNFATYSFDYSLNTLNTKHFPDKGGIFNLTVSHSRPLSVISNDGAEPTKYTRQDQGKYSFGTFNTLIISLRHYYSAGEKWTFAFSADGILITDTLSTRNNFYLLGGYEPSGSRSVAMTGYNANEVASKKFAGAGAEIDLEIFKNT